MPSVSKKLFLFLSLAILFVILQKVFSESERSSAMQAIPANIMIEELVLLDSQSDLRESCGLAIFSLSKSTLGEIDQHGLDFFIGSKTGRDNGEYYRYDLWSRTPGSIPDHKILRGLGCVKVDEGMVNALWNATKSEGSYIGIGYEYDLLVVPKLGLIVSSFNG